jgi:hypothetical protein
MALQNILKLDLFDGIGNNYNNKYYKNDYVYTLRKCKSTTPIQLNTEKLTRYFCNFFILGFVNEVIYRTIIINDHNIICVISEKI